MLMSNVNTLIQKKLSYLCSHYSCGAINNKRCQVPLWCLYVCVHIFTIEFSLNLLPYHAIHFEAFYRYKSSKTLVNVEYIKLMAEKNYE